MAACRPSWAIAILVVLLAAIGVTAFTLRHRRTLPSPEVTGTQSDVCPIQLTEVTEQTGIAFVHTDGSCGERYIVETVTAGLALLDYDNDGDIDIYFLNGAPLHGTEADPPPTNALYRNDGDWHFSDVTNRAGVGDTGFALGVAAADYDNDGDQDLFINNYGPNVLYRNNGDGTFADVTSQAGVDGGDRVGAGAGFLDMDADGDLDLYVANYVQFDYDNHHIQYRDGFPVYPGPREYPFEPDRLYRNNGDGTFSDASAASGIDQLAGSGMGMVCADYDNDGDTDIFVLNDVAANFLLINDGTGKFKESGLISGAACNAFGSELGSMGIDCGDFDNDGWLDFFMTSYQNESPVLYRNLGNGSVEDVTLQTGAGDGCFPYVNWGTGLVDFDNDGDRDLYIACGHLQDNIEQFDPSSAYRVRNVLLMNTGGKFANVSATAGDGMQAELSSRGAAFDDLDDDGDVDVVVLNSRSESTILRNDSPSDGHWIRIRLCGTRTNRDGVGARVTITAGERSQMGEVHSGRGYQSHWGSWLHFGLGDHNRVDRVRVDWIGGRSEVLERVRADQSLTIIEGQGIAVPSQGP